MRTRQAVIAVLVVAFGCGGSEGSASGAPKSSATPGTAGAPGLDTKKMADDATKKAKEAGDMVAGELAKAADSLEAWAKSMAGKASESGSALAQTVQAQMPQIQQVVDQVKAKLAAGDAKAQEMVTLLDDKLATLKAKLDTLTKSAATATDQMKTDVVTAVNDLVAQVKSSLA